MKSVAIGRGVSLTTVGLGGSQLGNVGRVSTDEQCAAAVDAAWRGGVRYFDTREAASTTGIGALIELRDQGVVRAIGAGMNQSAMLAAFVCHV